MYQNSVNILATGSVGAASGGKKEKTRNPLGRLRKRGADYAILFFSPLMSDCVPAYVGGTTSESRKNTAT